MSNEAAAAAEHFKIQHFGDFTVMTYQDMAKEKVHFLNQAKNSCSQRTGGFAKGSF